LVSLGRSVFYDLKMQQPKYKVKHPTKILNISLTEKAYFDMKQKTFVTHIFFIIVFKGIVSRDGVSTEAFGV
jgi:hypothetical protein